MEVIKNVIGERFKSLRMGLGLTLDEVAQITGVSKPMLGQIERGQSSPTLNTLTKISYGLKTPLTYLLQDLHPQYSIASAGDIPTLEDDEGRIHLYPMISFDPVRNFETVYITYAPGTRRISERHINGCEEVLFVVEGKLDVMIGGETISLNARQSIRYRADVSHGCSNPHSGMSAAYITMFYPQS